LSQNKQAKRTSNLSEIEQELVKLQNENLNLRMENEYLKGNFDLEKPMVKLFIN
jgi:regulator of replication initiation timing